MTFNITPELAKRINQGIAEAQKNIDREMKYSQEFRKASVIAENEAHIAKMVAALNAGVLVVS